MIASAMVPRGGEWLIDRTEEDTPGAFCTDGRTGALDPN